MARRKNRVSIPPQIRDDVVFASDRTCCICRQPERPTQIHHIDEDPSNNDPDNLAVLCMVCHTDQQRQGGFGVGLSAGLVRQYRDDWLRIVNARRADQASARVPARSDPPTSPVTSEHTRQHADRLRSWYAALLKGVREKRDYVTQLDSPAFGNAPLDFREDQLKTKLVTANRLIEFGLNWIRVEPGAEQVCEQYDAFESAFSIYVSYLRPTATRTDWFVFAMARVLYAPPMNRAIEGMQAAIRDHIARIGSQNTAR